jgi:hypothetical protein
VKLLSLPLLLTSLLFAQDGVILEGTITNKVTHAPVAGATVSAWSKDSYTTTTDDRGAYRITGMKPGQYSFRVSKTGFLERELFGSFVDLPLRVAGASTKLDAQLTPFATIRGRVLDPEGNPAPHAQVGFSPQDLIETDNDGNFLFDQLRPGTYTLMARPKSTEVTSQDSERTAVVLTFFPSSIRRAQAQPIVVRGGDDLSGIEIRLRSTRVYRIRGIVLDETGEPVPRPTVKLQTQGPELLIGGMAAQILPGARVSQYLVGGGQPPLEEAYVLAGDDGKFEFPAVPPGQWLLRGEKETTLGGRTIEITIADQDIDDLQISFRPRLTLSGVVDWGDREIPEASRKAGFMVYGPSSGGAYASPDGTLHFSIMSAGRYRIVPNPADTPPGYYLASIRLGDQEILGQSVELTPESPAIKVTYRPNAGRVRGLVEKGAGATVLLWPRTLASDVIPLMQCDSAGAFEFANVAPGDYSLLALDRLDRAQQYDDFLRSVLPGAARVAVQESSTATANLPLLHWPD